MNIIDFMSQEGFFHNNAEEISRLIASLWKTTDQLQKIVIDEKFIKITGQTFSGLMHQFMPKHYHRAMQIQKKNECQNKKKIKIVWHGEDVQCVRPDLNESKSIQVLECLKRNHDADIGINWEVIKCVAEICFPEKEET